MNATLVKSVRSLEKDRVEQFSVAKRIRSLCRSAWLTTGTPFTWLPFVLFMSSSVYPSDPRTILA